MSYKRDLNSMADLLPLCRPEDICRVRGAGMGCLCDDMEQALHNAANEIIKLNSSAVSSQVTMKWMTEQLDALQAERTALQNGMAVRDEVTATLYARLDKALAGL